MRVRVCRVDEVAPGELRSFEVDELAVPVLIANFAGRHFAASGMCPHEDVELADGELVGESIVCPGHAYRFDLRSGACEHDASLCLPTYEVAVLDGDLYIDLIRRPPR